MNNADKIQQVINDDLFPTMQNISDVKQVLEFMQGVSQNLSEQQVKGLILLEMMGENKRLHGTNPYKEITKSITDTYKKAVGETSVYLDTIEGLIPKPPKPIVLAEKDKGGR